MARSHPGLGDDHEEEEPTTFEGRIRELVQESARRVSVLPQTEPQQLGSQEQAVTDAWDIATAAQLRKWAQTKPEEVLGMLNELRRERDLAFGILDEGANLEKKNTKMLHSLNCAQDEVIRLRTRFEQEREQKGQLRADKIRLEEELKAAKEATTRENTPGTTTTSTKKEKLSTKLPDPPIFTDGKDPTWDLWNAAIVNKLSVNSDHFKDEYAECAYIASRLGGKAAEHILPRWAPGSSDQYQVADEMLGDLADIYEDSDKERTARLELTKLQQNNTPFSDFYSTFLMYCNTLKFNDEAKMGYLRDKVNYHLSTALTYQAGKFHTLSEMKKYLQAVDKEQRAKKRITTETSNKPKYVRTPTTGTGDTTVSKSTTEVTTDYSGVQCYGCKRFGHINRHCPYKKGGRASTPAKVAAVEEVVEEDDMTKNQ